MRELFRHEHRCQIVHDSFLSRGLADPWLLLVKGRIGGYGAISNRYNRGRLTEFYTLPDLRGEALPMFRELLAVTDATHIEAQTNMPLMLSMLYDCATNITIEKILFRDTLTTHLSSPGGVFRAVTPDDDSPDDDAEWVLEADGDIVACGGFLCHYNPPYGDVYMSVAESSRRRGYGSYLVQELKRICYEGGRQPAARCDESNVGSRSTLEKAGLLPCGRLLVGETAPVTRQS